MSQIITAPSREAPLFTSLFLAGGITACDDWQKEVIAELEYENVSIYNPRREYFNIADTSAAYRQTTWEYERLEQMDIFSMYFCGWRTFNTDQEDQELVQPICMYELGRNILRMQNRFPSDWHKRIHISIEEGYPRAKDVIIQTELCAPSLFVATNADPKLHADYLKRAIRYLNRSYGGANIFRRTDMM